VVPHWPKDPSFALQYQSFFVFLMPELSFVSVNWESTEKSSCLSFRSPLPTLTPTVPAAQLHRMKREGGRDRGGKMSLRLCAASCSHAFQKISPVSS